MDPKLLAVLAAVLRRRSVAAAALELGLTLPAVMRALAEIRKLASDPVVVRTAAEPSGWLTRALEATPLRLVGRVSYGMYLLHMQCIVIVTAFSRNEAVVPRISCDRIRLACLQRLVPQLASRSSRPERGRRSLSDCYNRIYRVV